MTRDDTVEILLPPRPESVALARLAVAGVAAAIEASPSDAADLKLAVSEVCTSFVRGVDGDDALIALRLQATPDVVTFEVEHPAAELDIEPNAASSDESLGLIVVEAVADTVEIETGETGARVMVAKRLAREED